MAQVSRTFTVAQERAKVVAYLRDFANATTWDPGSQSNIQTSDGPVATGTVWHNTSKLLGITSELDYTLTRDDPDHIVFEGTNKTASTSDDMTFRDVEAGRTEITYRATVRFSGVARVAEPLFWAEFQRIAARVVPQITEAVEAL